MLRYFPFYFIKLQIVLLATLFSMPAIFVGCSQVKEEVINIGYIGPLSTRATDLGIAPANALNLAIEQYNLKKRVGQPLIKLFVEDDEWEASNAITAYNKLKNEHQIKVLFISNSGGMIALQDQAIQDHVIMVNPTNSDAVLSSLNHNSFKIAKSTEEANSLIAVRIIELGYKKTAIIHYPNEFMITASKACKKMLDERGVKNTMIAVDKDQTDFKNILQKLKKEEYDSFVFFGYEEFGFAMKQARDLGILAPFYASNGLLNPAYYKNSEGTVIGTECSFFTAADGNYVLASEFLSDYQLRFGETPASIWPPMQAFDAMNIVLKQLSEIADTKIDDEGFDLWLRNKLLEMKYHQGVCGTISINPDGASKGIYFSLYNYQSEGKLIKIRR